jgi:hypothetical protein
MCPFASHSDNQSDIVTQDAILQMQIAADLVVQLDELRRHESDIPSRSELVRAAEARQKREIRSIDRGCA